VLALGLLVGCTFAPTLKVFAGEGIVDQIIACLIVVCSNAMLDSIFCVSSSNFSKTKYPGSHLPQYSTSSHCMINDAALYSFSKLGLGLICCNRFISFSSTSPKGESKRSVGNGKFANDQL